MSLCCKKQVSDLEEGGRSLQLLNAVLHCPALPDPQLAPGRHWVVLLPCLGFPQPQQDLAVMMSDSSPSRQAVRCGSAVCQLCAVTEAVSTHKPSKTDARRSFLFPALSTWYLRKYLLESEIAPPGPAKANLLLLFYETSTAQFDSLSGYYNQGAYEAMQLLNSACHSLLILFLIPFFSPSH